MGAYDLDGGVTSLAIRNKFTEELSKVAYSLGKSLKPFCFFADEYQKSHNVIDLTTFGGFENPGITLFNDIVHERITALKKSGVSLPDNLDFTAKKAIFIQYLMTVSICYIEAETEKVMRNGSSGITYDKCFGTRNPSLLSVWVGDKTQQTRMKYANRIGASNGDLLTGVVRFAKMTSSSKGNSITMPRNVPSTESMHCIPLFMVNAFIQGIKEVLSDSIVEFTFLKDNHTERKLVTTLNEGIIRKFYSDNLFVGVMLGGVEIDSDNIGGVQLSKKAHRGYIKVPELGASRYDSSGTRSLNFARILEAKKISPDEVDTTFIDISLDSVVDNFRSCLENCMRKTPQYMPEIYKAIVGAEVSSDVDLSDNSNLITLLDKIMITVESNEAILSTTYRRSLHSFLVQNPLWFPLYTGRPIESSSKGAQYGVAQLDW